MKHHSLQYILGLITKNSGGKTSGLVPVRYLQVTPDGQASDRWLFLSLLTSGNYAGLTPVGAFPWNHRPVCLVFSCTYLWMIVGLLFFHISIDRGFNWLSSYVKHSSWYVDLSREQNREYLLSDSTWCTLSLRFTLNISYLQEFHHHHSKFLDSSCQ